MPQGNLDARNHFGRFASESANEGVVLFWGRVLDGSQHDEPSVRTRTGHVDRPSSVVGGLGAWQSPMTFL